MAKLDGKIAPISGDSLQGMGTNWTRVGCRTGLNNISFPPETGLKHAHDPA